MIEALNLQEKRRIESLFKENSSLRFDQWGTSLDTLLSIAPIAKFFFQKYFRAQVVGLENIPEGPALFIANHGGQIPFDGMLIVYTLLTQSDKPRLARAMVERWVPTLPFIGSFFLKSGQIVGDQKNCLQLLQKGESVLVFPEGVRGSGKTIDQKYHLQKFPLGFYRLAQEAKVPIVPITLVGTEETYPSLTNLKGLAKMLKIPYIPITPTFPLLGPLGLIPLPCKISLKILPPLETSANINATDADIRQEVEKIQTLMQDTLNQGLARRGEKIFSKNAYEETT